MSCSPIAPGTALNDAVVAFWASAARLTSRLPPVTPIATPTASANVIVPVLFIAVLPSPAGAGHLLLQSSPDTDGSTSEPDQNSADPAAAVPFSPASGSRRQSRNSSPCRCRHADCFPHNR